MITTSEIFSWLVLLMAYVSMAGVTLFRGVWRHKVFFVQGIYALLSISALLMAIGGIAAFTTKTGILLSLTLLAALFLTARMHLGRLPSEFLRRNSLFTSVVSAVVFGSLLWAIIALPLFSLQMLLVVVLCVALAVAIGLGLQTAWALRHYIFDVKTEPISGGAIPTVTLAIPARNETLALAACLDAALQSHYEKLEILVLDDCSHDTTSTLIRSYAHAGVRFIRGDVPSGGWLGKSNAYNQLAKEASGELILFMGVDAHLHPESVTRLVRYIDAHKLDMVSVLPRLAMPLGAAVLLPSLRYIWQIILPLTRRRVPVSSEAWMIRRATLAAIGGFKGVRHKIIPEGSFARRLMQQNRYHFVIANKILPMEFAKSWRSQQRTAMRLLYPTFKRQPLRSTTAMLLLLLCGLLPFLILVSTALFSVLWWLAAFVSVLYVLLYALVLWRMQAYWWWLAMWLLPLGILQEILLILISMAKYEFSTVEWKGRNVCYPVLLHRRH